jgi:hypothetical protein
MSDPAPKSPFPPEPGSGTHEVLPPPTRVAQRRAARPVPPLPPVNLTGALHKAERTTVRIVRIPRRPRP